MIDTADMKFVKFAPDMRPAPDQGDGLLATGLNLLLDHARIGAVSINLEDAGEAAQVPRKTVPRTQLSSN